MIWPISTSNQVQFTENLITAIPKLKNVGVAAFLLVVTILLVRPNKLRRRWLRNLMLILGICLALPASLSILIAGCSLENASRPHVLVSPDRSRVADYTYEAGFLGRDYSGVTVRLAGSIHSDEAYFYFGPSDWAGTTVHWLDNQNLEIGYYLDPHGRTQQCNALAASVKIHCKILEGSMPPPDSSPTSNP